MDSLGNRIKYLREQKGLSQKDLASILNIANSTICQYESDVRVPSDDIKIKIADFFAVSLDYLLGRPENRNNTTQKRENEKVTILAREARDLSDVQLDLLRGMIKQFKESKNKR